MNWEIFLNIRTCTLDRSFEKAEILPKSKQYGVKSIRGES